MDDDKRPVGRPTNYSQELADYICRIVSTNRLGLHSIYNAKNPDGSKKFPLFPDPSTIQDWRLDYPEFSSQYGDAVKNRALYASEELMEMACDETNDYYVDDKGTERPNAVAVARSKLKIDTLKWIVAKVLPKIYGDKLHVETDNGDATELAKIRELIAKCLPKE
jgi:hypothetical protein